MPERDLFGHVVYAARALRRRPVMVASAVLTLSLGLGATTAVLTIIDAVLLHPIGTSHADDVVMLQEQNEGTTVTGFLYTDFERLEQVGTSLFEDVFASGAGRAEVRIGDTRLSVSAELVTPRYFDALGVPIAYGRALAPDAFAQGHVEMVVTDRFSRQLLVAPQDVVGREILVGRARGTIVGVTAAGFDGLDISGSTTSILLPISSAVETAGPGNYFADATVTVEGRGYSPSRWLRIGGRLTSGATPAAAAALWASTTSDAGGGSRAGAVPAFVPLWTTALPAAARASAARFTTLLLAASSLLLILGCATLAGVMTSRRQDRRHELAVRAALGAGRGQLVASLLAEGVLIAGCGIVGGLVAAHLMLSSMTALVIPGGVSLDVLDTAIGWRPVATATLLAAGTLAIFGLLPALAGRRPDLSTAFNGGHHTSARPMAHARRVAVAVQVAVCLVLAVGTLLFARSLGHALEHDVGVQASRLAYATVTFDVAERQVDVSRYRDALADRLGGTGVEGVTFGDVPLLSFAMWNQMFTIDGVEAVLPTTAILDAGPDYFETLGLTIVSGRGFSRADNLADPVRSAVVSEAFAERAWPGSTAVGRFVSFQPVGTPLEVVGVVEDASRLDLREASAPAVYIPSGCALLPPGSTVTFVAESSAPERTAAALAQAVREMSRGTPLLASRTLQARLEELAMPQRLGATFVGWLGAAALVIAAVGIYGTVAGFVAGRRAEMAIRRALGARDRDMVASTLGALAMPIGVGGAVGLLGAYGLAGIAQPFLFSITPGDPASFAIALIVVGIAVVAALGTGARGAVRADPRATFRDA